MAEFAFGVDDAIVAVVLLGGFGGLAKVMEKYFARHQHKKVVVSQATLIANSLA